MKLSEQKVKHQTAITITIDQLDNLDKVLTVLDYHFQKGQGKNIWLSQKDAEYLIEFMKNIRDNLDQSTATLAGLDRLSFIIATQQLAELEKLQKVA
jgi:hypothetical protein